MQLNKLEQTKFKNKDVELIDRQIKENKLRIPQFGKVDIEKRINSVKNK